MADNHIKWGLRFPCGYYRVFDTRTAARDAGKSDSPSSRPKVVKLYVQEVDY